MDVRCAHKTDLSHAMRCVKHDDKNLSTNKRTAHSRVSFHVRCVEGALSLGGHVVIGVVSLHHSDVIPNVEFFPSGFGSPIVDLWSDCIL